MCSNSSLVLALLVSFAVTKTTSSTKFDFINTIFDKRPLYNTHTPDRDVSMQSGMLRGGTESINTGQQDTVPVANLLRSNCGDTWDVPRAVKKWTRENVLHAPVTYLHM
eukprot:Lankesteria_metandrocarpae@DN1741_c0_g1_i1.p1